MYYEVTIGRVLGSTQMVKPFKNHATDRSSLNFRQHHDPAALSPGKSASVFIGKEARWAPQQSGSGDERKNFLRREWKLGRPVYERVALFLR